MAIGGAVREGVLPTHWDGPCYVPRTPLQEPADPLRRCCCLAVNGDCCSLFPSAIGVVPSPSLKMAPRIFFFLTCYNLFFCFREKYAKNNCATKSCNTDIFHINSSISMKFEEGLILSSSILLYSYTLIFLSFYNHHLAWL